MPLIASQCRWQELTLYDFDPTTSPQKSGKTRGKKSKTAAMIAGQI
jgi:hypothetical protein